jgi:SAM-dependent methyltransferase
VRRRAIDTIAEMASRARWWKTALRRGLDMAPLAARKAAAIALDRVWPGHHWVRPLLAEMAERDLESFHRFLWSHHLSYADTYDVARRFGAANIRGSRHLLLQDLRTALAGQGRRAEEVRSVFDTGCSLGYLLRHLEQDVFPSAEVLEGIDIDDQAIARGSAYLGSLGSKVRLHAGDLALLDRVMGSRTFDVVLCAGVLMYVRPPTAAAAVATMLAHCSGLVAMSGPAHPERDNGELPEAATRARDRSLLHNFDAMVRDAGGRVVARRWEGPRVVDGNTVYFVIAAPA